MHGPRGYRLSSIYLAVAAALGWNVLDSCATCAFRFAGYPNESALPTWTVPPADSNASGAWVINEENPIVYLGTDGTEEAVNCTGRSWQYLTADGEWRTNVTFPNDDQTSVKFDGFFNSTGSGEFTVSSIPASIAPAVSDTLYGRTIQANLTCNQDDMVDEGDSCVSFQVEFNNYSPEPDVDMALYRFKDPAVPGIVLPLAQPFSSGDLQLNEENPIVELDGSDVDNACNGDQAEYLAEDDKWYFLFTGIDGRLYNLSHVFYATDTDHLNIATIQETWTPNLEAALYNRFVRLLIHCNNAVNFEEGYLLFKVGNTSFGSTCESFSDLCVEDDPDNSSAAAKLHGLSVHGLSGVVMATATVYVSVVVAALFGFERYWLL